MWDTSWNVDVDGCEDNLVCGQLLCYDNNYANWWPGCLYSDINCLVIVIC